MFSSSQTKLLSYFKNAAQKDELRQSYIIKGEAGLGKKEVLKKICQYIMCDNTSACGKCNGCLSLDAGAHPDVTIISNGDKKTIEMHKIRDMIKEVYTKPVRSKHKLIVIQNAHLMDAAPQNAILKVIEEPPSYAVFILVCDNTNSILPTIISRSMVLELERWSQDDLKRIYPLPKEDEYMYTYCLGSIGMLKSISSDENFRKLRDKTISSFVKMVVSDELSVYEAIEHWLSNKENKDTLIYVLLMFLRDVVFFKNGISDLISNTDRLSQIQAVSDAVTFKKGFDMLSLVASFPDAIGKYGNFNMAAHTMLLELKKQCLSHTESARRK